MFKKTNPNPANNLVGDCVIRAISILTNEDWEYTFLELCIFAFSMHDMPSSNAVWGAYLIDLGYKRYVIPNVCPACFTVRQFCNTHPKGKYLCMCNASSEPKATNFAFQLTADNAVVSSEGNVKPYQGGSLGGGSGQAIIYFESNGTTTKVKTAVFNYGSGRAITYSFSCYLLKLA